MLQGFRELTVTFLQLCVLCFLPQQRFGELLAQLRIDPHLFSHRRFHAATAQFCFLVLRAFFVCHKNKPEPEILATEETGAIGVRSVTGSPAAELFLLQVLGSVNEEFHGCEPGSWRNTDQANRRIKSATPCSRKATLARPPDYAKIDFSVEYGCGISIALR
jgi:hypothetical protein